MLEIPRLVSDCLRSCPIDEASHAAVFLSGRAFPAYEETVLTVGGALLSRLLQDVTGTTGHQLTLAYRRQGDLGSAAFDLYTDKKINVGAPPLSPSVGDRVGSERSNTPTPITLHELEAAFRKIAATS